MPGQSNKYGLFRDIPEPVKRKVRQAAGFGCVVCGSALYTYEHVDPLFADAKEHDPTKMTLLCPNHQTKSFKGTLSVEKIKRHIARPVPFQKGYAVDTLELGEESYPRVTLGTLIVEETETIISIYGEAILIIEPPEVQGAPYRLSADLTDRMGRTTLIIEENELLVPTTNWDVEAEGKRITVRQKLGDISLVIRTDPPDQFIIERLDAYYDGIKLTCREGLPFKASLPNGNYFEAANAAFKGCKSAVSIYQDGIVSGEDYSEILGNLEVNGLQP